MMIDSETHDGNGPHVPLESLRSHQEQVVMIRQRKRPRALSDDKSYTVGTQSSQRRNEMTLNIRQQQQQQQQRRRRSPCRFTSPAMSLGGMLLMSLLAGLMFCTSLASTNEEVNWLSKDSVVLIVGATTSLLGSEVALALYRLFHCRVVMIDDLNNGNLDGLADQLSHLEFHRQSLFRVWQELDDHLAFYRMDPRSIVPDIDPGTTVDRLAHVFEKHKPTHVLVFPETPEYYRGETDDSPPRAGMLEGVLEQVQTFHENHPSVAVPHVVWTSSEEVYPTTGMWSEKDVPPMPRNKEGADAMVNEIIAQAYDDKGIPSVALRISKHIYGPFQEPAAPLFSIMESLLRKEESKIESANAGDFLYVDDAVDATLAALQLPNVPHSFAINVASGNSPMTLDQILTRARSVGVGGQADVLQGEGRRLRCSLAEQILNFHPRVSLTEGLKRSLAWHFDRMFPNGKENASSLPKLQDIAGDFGVATCNDAGDTECLRGTLILPCASECSHQQQCRPTPWDNVLGKLQTWTTSCPSILYTIRRSPPSKVLGVSPTSKSIWPDAHCNIAFIPSSTPADFNIANGWTVVPLQLELADVDAWLVPMWSPGKLFPRSQWAIYAAPNVVWDDLDRLMEAVHMQPEGGNGAVALLIGTRNPEDRLQNSSQRQAYRAIHIKATEFLDRGDIHDGFLSNVDAESWMIHRLGHPDSEQLRCDVNKEISGWKGIVDFHAAATFVFGLHDLWSQVLLHDKGENPWWSGGNVVSVHEVDNHHRRLDENNAEPSTTDYVKAKPRDDNLKEKQEVQEPPVDESELDEDEEEDAEEVHHFDHNGFGVTRKSFGALQGEGKEKENKEDDDIQTVKDDDIQEDIQVEVEAEVDPSQYDTWLGALSSSDTMMFVRLVDPAFVGAIFLDDYESFSSA